MGRNTAKDRKKKAEKAAVAEMGVEQGNGVAVPVASQAESCKEKGNQAFVQGKFDQALELYTKAIEQDEKSYSLYSNRYLFVLHCSF